MTFRSQNYMAFAMLQCENSYESICIHVMTSESEVFKIDNLRESLYSLLKYYALKKVLLYFDKH